MANGNPDYANADTDFDSVHLNEECTRKTLSLWRLRCLRAARTHYAEAERLTQLHRNLVYVNSAATIIVTIFAAAAAFNESSLVFQIGILTATVFFLITSILHYLSRADDRAIEHKLAANEFGNIQRKIERYLSAGNLKMGLLHNINRDINFAAKAYPMVNSRTWEKHRHLDEDIRKLEMECGSAYSRIVDPLNGSESVQHLETKIAVN